MYNGEFVNGLFHGNGKWQTSAREGNNNMWLANTSLITFHALCPDPKCTRLSCSISRPCVAVKRVYVEAGRYAFRDGAVYQGSFARNLQNGHGPSPWACCKGIALPRRIALQ